MRSESVAGIPARHTGLDVLRIAAAYAVVWLHVAGEVVAFHPSTGNFDWWIANIADSFSRWCVPVFVMLSGALLIPKARAMTPGAFLKNRLPRIVLITVFWTGVYLVFQWRTGPALELLHYGENLISGYPYPHLWYLYMLIGLYLFIPVIQRVVDALEAETAAAFTTAIFCIASVERLYGDGGGSTFLSMFLPYIAYFVAGYLLLTHPPQWRAPLLWTVTLLCGLAIAASAALLLPRFGLQALELAYNHFNPAVIAMSICIFCLAAKADVRLPLASLAQATLGVYLLHPIWVVALKYAGLAAIWHGPAIGIPLTATLAFILSALSARLLQLWAPTRRLV